jgi:hypothetical protein
VTVKFPDVSHYQQGLRLDGAAACIAKATQGRTFKDPAFSGFRTQARALGIPFAGYHWVTDVDIGDQAALAYQVLRDTPCMWDAEADGATVPRLLELTGRLRELGGNPTLVYLPRWWWANHLGRPDLRPLERTGLALISSHYTRYSDDGPGWAPYGGVTPTIWQYTNAAPFNGQRVDFNAFRGSAEQLRHVFEEGTMSAADQYNANAHGFALSQLKPSYRVIAEDNPPGPTTVVGNALAAALARLEAKVDRIEAMLSGVDDAAEAGAERGAQHALDGATVTTTIDTPEDA